MKAFLGMGLLGSNFVRAMIQKGEEVHVWNRTTSKARALEQDGAIAFEKVTDAVKDADIIHLTLKDDATVDDVLDAASSGFKRGVVIIDHTTTSRKGAIDRTKYWKDQGYTYLHAPVFMGPKNALESTGYMLVSGDQSVIEKVSPSLSQLTGKLINLGAQEGKAAAMKLTGNLFLLTLTGGLSDTLAFATAEGVSSEDVAGLFNMWNPAAMLPARLQHIVHGNFSDPSWELNMARKDARLMMEGAGEGNKKLTIIPAIAGLMDEWIEKGHGNDDWTVIAKDSLS